MDRTGPSGKQETRRRRPGLWCDGQEGGRWATPSFVPFAWERSMALVIEGEERIAAPVDKVWAGLNDPAVLKEAIPGCQSLEMKSPTEMAATVVLKIGPIKATF